MKPISRPKGEKAPLPAIKAYVKEYGFDQAHALLKDQAEHHKSSNLRTFYNNCLIRFPEPLANNPFAR